MVNHFSIFISFVPNWDFSPVLAGTVASLKGRSLFATIKAIRIFSGDLNKLLTNGQRPLKRQIAYHSRRSFALSI